MSTPGGQRIDEDSTQGPQTPLLNSVVDHRSVLIQEKISVCIVRVVWDNRASVSRLSCEQYNSLKSEHSLRLELSLTQLEATNQLPFETQSIKRFPVCLGRRKL